MNWLSSLWKKNLPFLEVDIAGQEILLRGKIDRVDQFNGTTRLIDYKTGKVEKPKLHFNNWEAFVGDYKRNPLFNCWSMLGRI